MVRKNYILEQIKYMSKDGTKNAKTYKMRKMLRLLLFFCI
jgi:hypothetical protein